MDHDQIQGKHCPNGLKFGTWVHHGRAMYFFTLGVTKFFEEKMMILQFVVNMAFFFAKQVPKVHCKTLKTIDAHKVNHIITPNQFMVECESSIPSPTDMGKPTLTIVDQSLTGAVEIKKNQKNVKPWHTSFV